ncbi:2308_t:CDS:10 [Funneliformis geosporum]|uniref:2308_t:CDS:1 n=1 Tax=Funneliformis geosporum TaxID=1117311 RepID=A0A9W4T1L7_9GLOM|nr:2308_t:CDS:10 [Funneliformis geosporum]
MKHEYFKRDPDKWGIIGFLMECTEEPFERKIDKYVKELETIGVGGNGSVTKPARKFVHSRLLAELQTITEFNGSINGNITTGTVNGGIITNGSPRETISKRSNEEKTERDFPKKRTKLNQLPRTQIKPSGSSRTFPLETNGKTPAHDDESDNESIMSDSPLYDEFAREMKMADETKEYYSDPESTESVNDDDPDDPDYVEYSSYDSSDNDDTDVDDNKLKSKIDLAEFEKTYSKMNHSEKWTLSTGKIVEDALHDFGVKCRHEHLCHSFVIDPNDKIYINEEVFTETELEEIRNHKLKPMPQMPQDLLTYLNSFRVSDISSLRNAIFKSQQWDSPYNRQTHFDHDWIRNTAYNLLHEYEAGSLEKDHLELWLLVHVWNFVDRGFGNVDGLETARKNRNRTGSAIVKMKRKIMGRRGDLIIRKVSTEYGCSEAGKSFEGNNGTKLLHERGIKAPKMMKDMLYSLCEAVGNEEKKIRKLQSIGSDDIIA